MIDKLRDKVYKEFEGKNIIIYGVRNNDGMITMFFKFKE